MSAATTVEIRYLAVANKNRASGGWMPVIEVCGVMFGDTYGTGMGADEAMAEAKRMAEEEATRYRGDYEVTVGPAQPPATPEAKP